MLRKETKVIDRVENRYYKKYADKSKTIRVRNIRNNKRKTYTD